MVLWDAIRSDVAGRIARVDAIARVASASRARARGEDARRRSSIGAVGAVGAVGRRARAARMMTMTMHVGTRARESATLERARDDDRGDDDEDDGDANDVDANDADDDESTRRCGNGSSSSASKSKSRRTARRDGALGVDRGRAVDVDVRG